MRRVRLPCIATVSSIFEFEMGLLIKIYYYVRTPFQMKSSTNLIAVFSREIDLVIICMLFLASIKMPILIYHISKVDKIHSGFVNFDDC